jgi:flagellar basal-body rod protein FlgF
MIRGFYTAASAARANEKRMNTVINNIANGETVGYKQDRASVRGFYEQLVSRMSPKEATAAGQQLGVLGTGIGVSVPMVDFAPGALQTTGRALDVALQGPGFIAVQTPQGERYTRAGNLGVDSQGRLTGPSGGFVLGANGPITVAAAGQEIGDITIDEAGRVFSKTQQGSQQVGQLRLVEVPANALRKDGTNYFEAMNAGAVRNSQQTTVVPGTLEGANVGKEQNSIEMMDVIRSYGSVQEMLRLQDQVIGQTVSEVGRVGQ